eukprot:gene15920-11392_t
MDGMRLEVLDLFLELQENREETTRQGHETTKETNRCRTIRNETRLDVSFDEDFEFLLQKLAGVEILRTVMRAMNPPQVVVFRAFEGDEGIDEEADA